MAVSGFKASPYLQTHSANLLSGYVERYRRFAVRFGHHTVVLEVSEEVREPPIKEPRTPQTELFR